MGQTQIQTTLRKNTLDPNHRFDFANAQILAKEKNRAEGSVKETVHIKNNPSTINFESDINKVSHINNGVIK